MVRSSWLYLARVGLVGEAVRAQPHVPPATGRAPTPTPLTPQNKRSVTPDTDTQSQRTKAPTTGPAVIATVLAATLDGRQILHKPFVQGWGKESVLRK